MIILENRETKSATLCNNDLKHLCEYTNVIVSTDDNEEWIKICTLSNGYVLLKTYAKETTILRTDSIFTHNMSFVYNVEESEEVQQEQDEEIQNGWNRMRLNTKNMLKCQMILVINLNTI